MDACGRTWSQFRLDVLPASQPGLAASPRLRDIPRAVCGVVLAFVPGAARNAVVVSLPAGPSAPSEVLDRLGLSAAPAAPQRALRGVFRYCGRMFAPPPDVIAAAGSSVGRGQSG